ncbi:MAG TPA: hypothetical protein VG815_03220 [Chloroflexota bacterium]|jgi:hypothetical protein|nr:hypothetical protein [Chloroflexota bacterium]
MKHSKFEERLARRQELTDPEETELSAHLLACGACRATAAEYESHDEALQILAQDRPIQGLRAAVLQKAAIPLPSKARNRLRLQTAALAAAVVISGLGLGLARGWDPLGGQAPLLTQAQAVRAALIHTVAAPYRKLPATVRVTARLGAYSGVRPAWIVTISGPGVSVLSPQSTLNGQLTGSTVVLHAETAVVNGRTGAYVETFTEAG